MPKPLTAPARLSLLLPWLNGALDEHHFEGRNPEPVAVWTDYPAIRRALAEFVESFDGSVGAGHLEAVADPAPDRPKQPAARPTDEELGDLEARLHILLEEGFGGPGDSVLVKSTLDEFNTTPTTLFFPAASLRFAVRSAGRQKPGRRDSGTRGIVGGVTALRNYQAAGAYVLQVLGPALELVPFLVAHLLTAPNMVAVKRCERHGCTHFVITATAKRGRPQRFCSPVCREANKEFIEQRVRKLTAEGRTSRHIADLLGISLKKVMSVRKQSKEE